MIFITETGPSNSFSEKSAGICSKFRKKHEHNFFFLQNDRQFQPKIVIWGISVKFWIKLSNTEVKIFIKRFIQAEKEIVFRRSMLENQYLWINL